MRHVTVRRTALILAAVFIVSAGLFAWFTATERETASQGAEAPAEAAAPVPAADTGGAMLYETYCARCHPAGTLRIETSAEKLRELEAFLQTHGRSSDEEDRLIVDYLAGR